MTYRNDRLGALLRDASRGLSRAFAARTQGYGLSQTQWRLLGQVMKQGPMTQTALADLLDVEPISVSRLIDRMEQAGWVRREPHPQDRRARVILPTERAAQAAPAVLAVVDEVTEAAMADLSPEERAMLIGALNRIIETLGRGEGSAPASARTDGQDHE